MTATERQRRRRKKNRAGLNYFGIWADEAMLSDIFVRTRQLDPLLADNREMVRQAIERHLASLVAVDVDLIR